MYTLNLKGFIKVLYVTTWFNATVCGSKNKNSFTFLSLINWFLLFYIFLLPDSNIGVIIEIEVQIQYSKK